MVRAAIAHGVAPLVHEALTEASHEQLPLVRTGLYDARRDALIRHLVVLRQAAAMAAVLTAAGVRFAVVKGPVLTELAYGRPERRPYADLDLLVHPQDLRAALDSLGAAGWSMLDRNWVLARRQMRAELSLVYGETVMLDLHWHLVNERPRRAALNWHTADLLERTRTVDVGGVELPVLDPVDAMMHLALHATTSGLHRLQWPVDLFLWNREQRPDPGLLRERCAAASLTLLVATALDRTQRVLGVPGPSLPGGQAWRGLIRVLDRWRPPGRPPTEHLSWRALVSATGTSDLDSLRTLSKVAVTDGVVGGVQRAWHARHPRPLADNPLHAEGGGEPAREAYLAAVAQEYAERSR
nr:nucleotidyltransferase family protein [Motilibacter aurantiacus]